MDFNLAAWAAWAVWERASQQIPLWGKDFNPTFGLQGTTW
jgi:hypothetical protein